MAFATLAAVRESGIEERNTRGNAAAPVARALPLLTFIFSGR
jgi:hypothetical protein